MGSEMCIRDSAYIYQYYPAEKQAQDEKWASNYSTKLKAAGVKDLEAVILMILAESQTKPMQETVEAAVKRLSKKILKKIQTVSETDPQTYATQMLTKLVKIAMRNAWVEQCVAESKLAVAEGREVELPEFCERVNLSLIHI